MMERNFLQEALDRTLTEDMIIRDDVPTVVRCRSGCKTKDHASYAECLQDAGIGTYLVRISMGEDGTAQKKWDRELDDYKALRKEGVQPDGTVRKKIDEAKRLSDTAGAAYGRDFSRADPL